MVSEDMKGIQSHFWSDKCKLKSEWDSILYIFKYQKSGRQYYVLKSVWFITISYKLLLKFYK